MISTQNLLIIDSRNLLDRFWYATKDEDKAYKLFFKTIDKAMEKFSISHLAFTIDTGSKETIRHNFYDDYKSGRNETPEEIVSLSSKIEEGVELKYAQCMYKDHSYEADDFIASFVELVKGEGFLTFIMSTDKDLQQLITNKVFVVDFSKGLSVITKDTIIEKFGFEPKYILDYLSLMGDASDSIPGAKGVGKVSAAKLIVECGGMKDIFKNEEGIISDKIMKKLEDQKTNIILSYKLVTLVRVLFRDKSKTVLINSLTCNKI